MGERSPLFFFHKHKVALFRIDSGDGVGLAMPDAIWNPAVWLSNLAQLFRTQLSE